MAGGKCNEIAENSNFFLRMMSHIFGALVPRKLDDEVKRVVASRAVERLGIEVHEGHAQDAGPDGRFAAQDAVMWVRRMYCQSTR